MAWRFYDSNGAPATAGSTVDSVFGRTGDVIAAVSDYDASQVDNDSGVAGARVSDALDTLDAGKSAIGHGHTASDVSDFDTEVANHADVTANTLGYYWFVADTSEFKVLRNGPVITVTNLIARGYGGTLTGLVRLSPENEGTNMLYEVDGFVEEMSFKKLAELVAPEAAESDGYTGKVDGRIRLTGKTGDGNEGETAGEGSFQVSEGNIFNIPLFGDLSGMLAKTVPGLNYVLRQTDAGADFVVEGTVVSTDDLRIEGDVLSIKADGTYDWVDSDVDFDVELRFLKKKTVGGKILTTILWPVTKMFRVRLRGTAEEPDWRSVNF